MDIWKKHTSPLGYESNGNRVDTYGVDHSGFTTRDELQYQTARINRENDLMTQYNNQGVTSNYPQYTTNFWGSSADNNYGFGRSNIGNNIENRQQTMTPISQMTTLFGQPQVQQPETSAWDTVKQRGNDFADVTQAGTVGYATGTTLGNFDEIMGTATAALTGNPDNYKMGRDTTRKLQNDLRERHPYIYGGSEFLGAMTSPMHLFKDTTKVNKALNAATDTLNASAGYAENWNDFGTNLIVNGAANTLGLPIDKIPYTRGGSIVGRKFIKQGINSSADKLKNMYYNNDEER